MPNESLKNKTVKGVWWTAADSVLRYGVAFVVGVILARLLSPDEYGLIGILTIFITLFEIIVDGGLINALIRKQNAEEIDYCTVFYTNLALAIIMAAVIFLSAEMVSNFFERKELVALTRVMSVIVIIHALALVQRARLTKAINFKTQTKITFVASVSSGVVGIVMAYAGYGVWALVAQQITNAGIITILFWVVNRWIPKLQFSMTSFTEMWSFGWKLLLSGIFNSISNQAFQFVIGKSFKPATLGQYTRAQQFGTLFSSNITTIVQRVSFPVLSEIQDDPVRLKAAYKRVIKVTVFPTFILMMCLAACAKPLLIVLIGVKWTEAAYYLQIICFMMMLYPLHALNLNAIQVMGRSDLTLKINIIKNFLIVFPVIIGLLYGVYWMLFVDVVRGYVCYYLNAYYSKPLLNYSIKEQIHDILPSFVLSLVIAIPLYLVSFFNYSPFCILVIQICLGLSLFWGVCERIKMYEYIELKKVIAGLF